MKAGAATVGRSPAPREPERSRAGGLAAEGPRPRLTGRAALLLLILTVGPLLAVAPARAYLEQRERIAELERRAEILTGANAELTAEVDGLRDPIVLERLARECLGMVRPGEIAFVTVTEGGGSPGRSDC